MFKLNECAYLNKLIRENYNPSEIVHSLTNVNELKMSGVKWVHAVTPQNISVLFRSFKL